MSWLSKILPPKVQVSSNKMNVPEGMWRKCENCNEILYHTDLDNNLKVCPKCEHHHPLTARERINMLIDTEDQVEIGMEVCPVDILKFKDTKKYTDRLADTRKD